MVPGGKDLRKRKILSRCGKNVDILSITVSMLYHFNLLNAMPICH